MLLFHHQFTFFLALSLPCLFFLAERDQQLKLALQDTNELLLSYPSNEADQNTNTVTANDTMSSYHQHTINSSQSIPSQRYNSTSPSPYVQSPTNFSLYATNQTMPGECSCLGNMETYYFCCQRAIVVVHKMGVTAVQHLRDKYMTRIWGHISVQTPEIMDNHSNGALFESQYRTPEVALDYRHIVVTRNWFEAIVSGYLYHKTGRECWLDWFGQPDHDGWLLNNNSEKWEPRIQELRLQKSLNLSWTPGRGRDLCQYLRDESEEEGLRVYVSWAAAGYLFPLQQFRRERLEMEKSQGLTRTKFLCFEQLTTTPESFLSDSMNWLFPTDATMVDRNELPSNSDHNRDGHATDQDPKLRSRLRQLVARIDADIFGRSIARGSADFGCYARG